MSMRMVLSSSFSGGFLGGIAVWAFLSVNGPIWAAVVAWGCFFLCGGDAKAVRIAATGNFLGILTAWTAGIFLTLNPASVPGPVWAGLVIGSLVMVMIFIAYQLAAPLGLTLAVVPSTFLGAATTFAFLSMTPDRISTKILFSLSFENAIITVPICMFLGNAVFGFATAKMTDALGTPSVGASAARAS